MSEKTGLSVGLKRGHIVTRREKVARPAARKGVSTSTHIKPDNTLRWAIADHQSDIRELFSASAIFWSIPKAKILGWQDPYRALRMRSSPATDLYIRCLLQHLYWVLGWSPHWCICQCKSVWPSSQHSCPCQPSWKMQHVQRQSKRVKFVRDIVKEVAGLAPYERRATELLKVGRDKRALSCARERWTQ